MTDGELQNLKNILYLGETEQFTRDLLTLGQEGKITEVEEIDKDRAPLLELVWRSGYLDNSKKRDLSRVIAENVSSSILDVFSGTSAKLTQDDRKFLLGLDFGYSALSSESIQESKTFRVWNQIRRENEFERQQRGGFHDQDEDDEESEGEEISAFRDQYLLKLAKREKGEIVLLLIEEENWLPSISGDILELLYRRGEIDTVKKLGPSIFSNARFYNSMKIEPGLYEMFKDTIVKTLSYDWNRHSLIAGFCTSEEQLVTILMNDFPHTTSLGNLTYVSREWQNNHINGYGCPISLYKALHLLIDEMLKLEGNEYPLHEAARYGDAHLIRVLIEDHHCSPMQLNDEGDLPYIACLGEGLGVEEQKEVYYTLHPKCPPKKSAVRSG